MPKSTKLTSTNSNVCDTVKLSRYWSGFWMVSCFFSTDTEWNCTSAFPIPAAEISSRSYKKQYREGLRETSTSETKTFCGWMISYHQKNSTDVSPEKHRASQTVSKAVRYMQISDVIKELVSLESVSPCHHTPTSSFFFYFILEVREVQYANWILK